MSINKSYIYKSVSGRNGADEGGGYMYWLFSPQVSLGCDYIIHIVNMKQVNLEWFQL